MFIEVDTEQNAIDLNAAVFDENKRYLGTLGYATDATTIYGKNADGTDNLSGQGTKSWAEPRQGTNPDFDFWIIEDPRDVYPANATALTAAMNATGITYRTKPEPYEHDWTDEEREYWFSTQEPPAGWTPP